MIDSDSQRIPLLLTAVVLFGCTSPQGETPPAPDLESLRTEVLAVEDAMNLAVDALDCETGMAPMLEAEPIFVSNAAVIRTKPELAAQCEQMVAARTGAVFTVETRTANMLSEDAATVVREGNYAISFKDGTSQEMYMVMTTVWSREDGTPARVVSGRWRTCTSRFGR